MKKALGIDPSKKKYSDLTKDDNDYDPQENDEPLPEFFDAREKWSDCIKGIGDQHSYCSCLAFSSSAVLSDRICIHSRGEFNITLSSQDLISCDILEQGSNGGFPFITWTYLVAQLIITEECRLYTS